MNKADYGVKTLYKEIFIGSDCILPKVVLRYCLPSLNTFLIVLLLDYHFHDWSEIQQWSPGLLVL